MLASAASLAALVLAAGDLRLETSLAAGGGWESNLNHAAPAEESVGAAFLSLRGTGGLALDVGPRTGLYAGLRLEHEAFGDVPDLSTTAVGAELSFVRELGERWAVVLSPSASYAWAGLGVEDRDPGRDAWAFGGRATLRVKPVPRLALRAFYGYVRTEAVDAVFSSERNRVGGSAEWRVAGRTFLGVGYAHEEGAEVYYRPLETAVVVRRMGPRPVSSFGDAEEAYSGAATARSVSPSLEIGLAPALHLRASYEFRWVTGEGPYFESHAVFGGLVLQR
jgi:hypothetical protein